MAPMPLPTGGGEARRKRAKQQAWRRKCPAKKGPYHRPRHHKRRRAGSPACSPKSRHRIMTIISLIKSNSIQSHTSMSCQAKRHVLLLANKTRQGRQCAAKMQSASVCLSVQQRRGCYAEAPARRCFLAARCDGSAPADSRKLCKCLADEWADTRALMAMACFIASTCAHMHQAVSHALGFKAVTVRQATAGGLGLALCISVGFRTVIVQPKCRQWHAGSQECHAPHACMIESSVTTHPGKGCDVGISGGCFLDGAVQLLLDARQLQQLQLGQRLEHVRQLGHCALLAPSCRCARLDRSAGNGGQKPKRSSAQNTTWSQLCAKPHLSMENIRTVYQTILGQCKCANCLIFVT